MQQMLHEGCADALVAIFWEDGDGEFRGVFVDVAVGCDESQPDGSDGLKGCWILGEEAAIGLAAPVLDVAGEFGLVDDFSGWFWVAWGDVDGLV